ncbi:MULTISPECIES: hypothetical protein [Lelliottia]|uniref:DUF4241 domain-containing protein n=1 Tax=Lelliottia aquatilis TaxID=2080838 RepID=A0ABX5A2W4_9ENTR|nr:MULTISPECIES: hypothetical protein [Lelliottia]POZ15174.1 hypothetical protein C3Z09_15970 [Lelliottia aquatilis]POZ24032.1 hypothetical protein C3712_07395 [Lelliottia aquatilis]POZ27566.1 hypothetical protein C3708_08260 [Lelliottia sp. 7254-16]POZ29837.1 hypothetical protein C3711_01470 [Lelliottia aquatilis]POZ35402.1 hypothetical protein C3710_01470 [Lelliottia aquatilis]
MSNFVYIKFIKEGHPKDEWYLACDPETTLPLPPLLLTEKPYPWGSYLFDPADPNSGYTIETQIGKYPTLYVQPVADKGPCDAVLSQKKIYSLFFDHYQESVTDSAVFIHLDDISYSFNQLGMLKDGAIGFMGIGANWEFVRA